MLTMPRESAAPRPIRTHPTAVFRSNVRRFLQRHRVFARPQKILIPHQVFFDEVRGQILALLVDACLGSMAPAGVWKTRAAARAARVGSPGKHPHASQRRV